jgi:Tir chaperone family protein CesT
MVTDLFGSLLQELGKAMKIELLRTEETPSYLFKYNNGISVQLELDQSGRSFLLCSDLGAIPLGKYRENLFREALKSNDLPPPLHGVLSYSQQTDHLVLFEKLPLAELNGEKIAAALQPFTEKALLWSEAIKHNEIPAIQGATPSPGGVFGLRP